MDLDTSSFVADPELIAALDKRATRIACGPNQCLFRQGELPLGLFIVHKEGDAELTMESSPGEIVLRAPAHANSLLGLPGLIGGEPYTLSATARKGANIGFVQRIYFFALMQSQPLLSVKILQVLAAEVRSARQALLQM